MNNPIIDPSTLTKEQREVIRKVYVHRRDFESSVGSILQIYYNAGAYKTLEWIFGKDFFKKGE